MDCDTKTEVVSPHFSKLQPKQKWIFLLNLFLPRICVFFLSESCFSTKKNIYIYICFFPQYLSTNLGGINQPVLSQTGDPVLPGRGCPIATALGEVATTGRRWRRGFQVLKIPSMMKEVLHQLIWSGQIIATSHDLTPNGGLIREIPLFQGNLGL